jgi:septum site-determining protein MinD
LRQALIKDKRFDSLFLLPAAQTKDKTSVQPEEMKVLCEEMSMEFDYVIIDCPAGIEQGFKNAIAGADKAIVVTTPEISAVRDADRIIGLLEANELRDPKLIINRVRQKMVAAGDMMGIDDILDILAVDLLGVVPEDEAVIITTNRGETVVQDERSRSGQAYRNIVRRIVGEDIPLINLDEGGLFNKIRRFIGYR